MSNFTFDDVELLDCAIIAIGAASEEWDVFVPEIERSYKERAALEELKQRIMKEID